MQWGSCIFSSSPCFATFPAPELFPECTPLALDTHPFCSGYRADMGCLLWHFVVMPSRPARPWRRDCSVHCWWLLSCPLRPSTEHGDSPFLLCPWLSSWLLWRLLSSDAGEEAQAACVCLFLSYLSIQFFRSSCFSLLKFPSYLSLSSHFVVTRMIENELLFPKVCSGNSYPGCRLHNVSFYCLLPRPLIIYLFASQALC